MADEKRFHVGDIVRTVDNYDSVNTWCHTRGHNGTVVAVRDSDDVPYDYTVDFGLRLENTTHDCNGKCPDRTGRWFYDDELVLVSPADEENAEPELCDVSSFDDLL